MNKSIVTLLVGATVAAASALSAAPKDRPVGLQLYSLRADFAKNVPGTLDRVKAYGFKYVELAGTYNLHPARFKEMLDARGLVPVAGHFGYEQYRDKLDDVIKEAKTLGLKYAGCAWIPHQGAFTEQDARNAAAVFNKAGAALAKEGIKFFYHNHGYEFEKYKDGTLMDLLMEETKPELVAFEMDVLWTHFPGQDPVKWLKKYGSRWELMHLKDLKIGVPTGSLSGSTDVRNDVILGTGQINLKETIKAARKAGVKYYFIEDESPTAGEQIPESLKFLDKQRF